MLNTIFLSKGVTISDIKIKSRVECSDGPCGKSTHLIADPDSGKVGKVDGLVVDPDSGEITYLLIRKGRLWGARDISVPLTAIEGADKDEIHLNIDKQAIKDRPSVKLKPHYG